jgi:hypothetical protein
MRKLFKSIKLIQRGVCARKTVFFYLPCLHVITNKWLQAMCHALQHVRHFFRHKEVFTCACRATLFESFQAAAAKC